MSFKETLTGSFAKDVKLLEQGGVHEKRSQEAVERRPMGRALKIIFLVAALAALGLVSYAMLADLPPPTKDISVDLEMPSGPGR